MNHRFAIIAAFALLTPALISGCAPQNRSAQQVEADSIHRGEDDRVAELSKRVYSARSAAAEATALQVLRAFELEHGLTHELSASRTDTAAEVQSATTYPYPLLVTIRIRRAGDLVHTFSFVPLNNANLAQLER